MKRKLLSFVACAFFASTTFSQSLPNAGFETWTNQGLYDEADNWISLNMFSLFGMPITTTKSIESHSGTYAVKLETVANATDTLPGLLISGLGDVLSQSNVPFAFRPARVLFYYKGGPAANDTAFVGLNLTKWDAVNSQQIVVGGAGISITSIANNYNLADITIDYMTADIPDTIMFFATSSNSNVNIPGSNLFLDDISFMMSGVGIYENQMLSSSVYPNPAKDKLNFFMEDKEIKSVVILDLSGRIIEEVVLDGKTKSVSIEHFKNGTYLYQLKNEFEVVSIGKFEVVK